MAGLLILRCCKVISEFVSKYVQIEPLLSSAARSRRTVRWSTMDNSPTALFDSYEQDFQQIVQSIRDKLDGDAKDQQAGKLSVLQHKVGGTKSPSRAAQSRAEKSGDGTR